jgi:hypothetical protein
VRPRTGVLESSDKRTKKALAMAGVVRDSALIRTYAEIRERC